MGAEHGLDPLPRARGNPLSFREQARLVRALYLVLVGIAAVPLFVCTYPPLTDYPNHLARMHVLRFHDRSAPLRAMADVVWRPVPNLAMDLVVPFLPGLPDHVAGRVFVFLVFVALSGGALLLQHALLGHVTLGALLGVPLVFNGILAWGFLNYLMGLGLMLAAFALYVRLRAARPAVRVPLTSLAALAVYLSHFHAFALYGVAVVVFELDRFWRSPTRDGRRLCADLGWAALQAAVPAPLLVLFGPQHGEGGLAIAWVPLKLKLLGIAYVTSGLHPTVDLLTVALLVAAFAFQFGRGTARLLPPTLPLLVVLGALFAVLPGFVLSSAMADRRIVVALGFVLAAGLAIERPTRRAALGLAASLAAATVLQAGITAWRWAQWDAEEVRPLQQAMARLPVGARLAFAHPKALGPGPMSRCHLPSLVTLERDGFSPNFFSHLNVEPTVLTPAYARLAQAPSADPLYAELEARARRAEPSWSELFEGELAGYDALLLMFQSAGEAPDLSGAPLHILADGADFRLYAIDRAALEPPRHAYRHPTGREGASR